MSGGYFNYEQYRLSDISEDLEVLLDTEDYPKDVMVKIEQALKMSMVLQVTLQRIDWFVSGDDGIEAFRSRLSTELEKVNKLNNTRPTITGQKVRKCLSLDNVTSVFTGD